MGNKVPVEIGGSVFDVRLEGPEGAPAVLLLHGFPENAALWDGVAPALHAAGLRTVAPDQRGYSPGARPAAVEDYAMRHVVADALGLLDALELDTVHVLGHDWGAIVGWHLAGRHAARVLSLTAVSVPHPVAHGEAIRTDPDQQEKSGYMRVFRRPDAEELLLADDARRLRRMLPFASAATYIDPMLAPGALTGALNWYRAMSRADLDGLGPVAVPTTYLWGTEDIAVSRAAAEGCAAYVTADYRFVELPGAGHWVPELDPDTVAREALARITAG